MKKISNIYLIGPMGSGKTSVGKLLAAELGLKFIDIDHFIEKKSGVNIPWIFDVEGESGFRAREQQAVKELVEKRGLVLATGGGTVAHDPSRNLLAGRGLIIYLHATPEQQLGRVSQDTNRPLVANGQAKDVLQALFEKREPLYREIADVVFNTGEKGLTSMVRDIVNHLEKEGYRL